MKTGEKSGVSDEEFIRMFTTLGPVETSRMCNIGIRNVYRRRKRLEERYDKPIPIPSRTPIEFHSERRIFNVDTGVILVGSDAHYWPGISTTAHRAFLSFIKKLKPVAVVLNGDVFDGASISRHPAINYEDRPQVADEIAACTARLEEIEDAVEEILEKRDKGQEVLTMVRWSADVFMNKKKCAFCGKSERSWTEFEDAVCLTCDKKWNFDPEEDAWIRQY